MVGILPLDENLEDKENFQQVNLSHCEWRVLYFHSKFIEKTTGYHWMAMQELMIRAISAAQEVCNQTVSDCRRGSVEGQIRMVDQILDNLYISLARITDIRKYHYTLQTAKNSARKEIIEKLVAS